MKRNTKNKIHLSTSDALFYRGVEILLVIVSLMVLYPLIYVLSASFSSGAAVSSGKVVLFPVDFSLEGYKTVFSDARIFVGYRNSIFYTVVGTLINLTVTFLAAYPLSRKDLVGRNFFMFLFSFTMFFGGGMIPSYILMRQLKLLNTVWAMLLPGALSVYNMIITRTFFQNNIPDELFEAAKIDGCTNRVFFFTMVLPLSKAITAVMALFYAVGHWNSYFNAFLYLHNDDLYPLQIFLRDILVANSIDPSLISDPELLEAKLGLADLLKFSLIVVSTVPLLIVYPFVQKYFVQGVMIGSIKG